MMLDFKEIPEAHLATGNQDTFEMFARDFFSELGFKIIVGPDRGADGGRDLIIEEEREGSLGKTNVRWLVSCKHKAHSGNSVTDKDENNIRDRIHSNKVDGFIGFYSTIPSAGLQSMIRNITEGKEECLIFDRESIEKFIIEKNMKGLMKRYFPNSLRKYEGEEHRVSNFLDEYFPLECEFCSKDLLEKSAQGMNIIVFFGNYDDEGIEYVEDIYWSCKGECDEKLKQYYKEKGFRDLGWEDIADLIIPTKFIDWVCAILNNMKYGDVVFSDEAFEKLKKAIICISQLVFKDTTEEKKERIRLLKSIQI